MSTSPYAADKVLYHLERLQALRNGRPMAPIHVQLIISDLCNQDCTFCAYRMTGYTSNELFNEVRADGTSTHNPHRFLAYDKVVEILEDCQAIGVKAIQVTGGGEPTLHPQFVNILDQVVDRGLDLAVVTNGWRLGAREMQALLRATWVRVSLDAASADRYRTIRRTTSMAFETVLQHLREFVALKQATRSAVTIGIGFVVTRENWQEVLEATRLARDLGVDNIRLSAVFQPERAAYFAPFFETASALCREAEALSSDTFRVINNFGERVSDLALGAPDYAVCGYQHVTTYIGADQQVYRCCVLAYSRRGLLGSLRQQRFKDLWAARSDDPPFDARGCPQCQFNGKNRAILAVLRRPPHENFV